jgi:hypothetical protein
MQFSNKTGLINQQIGRVRVGWQIGIETQECASKTSPARKRCSRNLWSKEGFSAVAQLAG